jgi:hypothetical protein
MGLLGRLCGGACLRVLDTLHWPHSGGDPVGSNVQGCRHQRGRLLAIYFTGLGIPFRLAAFTTELFSLLFSRIKQHLN